MKEIFLLIIFFIFYLFLNVFENYYREKWKYDNNNYKYYSKLWHRVQFIRWSICFIYLDLIIFQYSITHLILLLPLSILWWILFDGLLNVLRGRKFFYQSKYLDLSELEKYNKPLIKLFALITSLLISIGMIKWLT